MTTQKRTRRKYTEDFKREAVALITQQHYKVTDAARSLDLRPDLLRRWKRGIEAQDSGESLSQDEREELRRLRRENRELKMEKEILKKASAYFAREMK
jgi:transposase